MSEDDLEAELARLREAPLEEVIAGQLFYLLQLAAVRLAAEPPDLTGAQLLIDVVGAVVATGAERLGEHVELYRSALAEVQQVYVRAAAR